MKDKTISKDLAQKAIEKIQQAQEYYDRIEALANEHKETLKMKVFDKRNVEPCKYCDPDSVEAGDPFLLSKFDMGVLGEFEIGVCMYTTFDNSYHSKLSVYSEYKMSEHVSEVLEQNDISINYCPFCGRKLH